jgi:hypothetical protein
MNRPRDNEPIILKLPRAAGAPQREAGHPITSPAQAAAVPDGPPVILTFPASETPTRPESPWRPPAA